MTNKSPDFSVTIEGKDRTITLANRLMNLTLTDNRGFEADQLDIELDDADGLLEMPRRGAVINLALGWKGVPLFNKGSFTVDEVEHGGAPDKLTIRARSADFRQTLNVRRDKSWHNTTLQDVVSAIASKHSLKLALGQDIASTAIDHIDQTNESDGSFLMRLARLHGAIASVKNGNLLFIRQGQAKTAIKKNTDSKQGDYLVGTDDNVLVLSRTYASRDNAARAAKAQWEKLQRGVATFSLQLAEGRADLYTEMPVKVTGFKQQIDEAEWVITTLTHTVSSDGGFTTSIELEVMINQ